MHPRRFLVTGLPRSGTAWLSAVLTCGSSFCYQELTGFSDTWDQLLCSMQTSGFLAVGNSDSGAVFIWRGLVERIPDLRIVCIRRNPVDCAESWSRIAGIHVTETVSYFSMELDACILETSPLVVDSDDLSDIVTLRKIWAYATGDLPVPQHHLEKMCCVFCKSFGDGLH